MDDNGLVMLGKVVTCERKEEPPAGMENPLLSGVLEEFPDVDAAALPWPAGAEGWTAKELKIFIGSGGFIKPKGIGLATSRRSGEG